MEPKLNYKCLILDHDDTVMDSTASIHYPAFLSSLNELRPGTTISLDDYFRVNFDPGFLPYLTNVLSFTPEELDRELEIWKGFVKERIPAVFPAVARIIRRQKEAGGLICVISHSFEHNIRRDYKANGLPQPDAVYGWEQSPDRRKPAPWPLEQVLARFGLRREDALVVDDLKPGYDMAQAVGVPFAAACWAYDVPEIRAFMESNCVLACTDPEKLAQALFD